MNKILIVDDHAAIRLAVRTLFEREGNCLVLESPNGTDALSLTRELEPNLVVLDLSLPKLDGLEVLTRLRSFNMTTRVLVFTSHNPIHFSHRCKKAGAAGFVWKQGNLMEVIDAAKAIQSGFTYFPNLSVQDLRFGSSQIRETEQLANLGNREMVVLECLAEGMLNKDIAERMLISEKTVSTYKTRLLIKLNMNSLLELIEFAKRNEIAH